MINSQRNDRDLDDVTSISKGMGDQFSAEAGKDDALTQYIKGDG